MQFWETSQKKRLPKGKVKKGMVPSLGGDGQRRLPRARSTWKFWKVCRNQEAKGQRENYPVVGRVLNSVTPVSTD